MSKEKYKRYHVTDNKIGKTFKYSKFQWDLAWGLAYIIGIISGIIITKL